MPRPPKSKRPPRRVTPAREIAPALIPRRHHEPGKYPPSGLATVTAVDGTGKLTLKFANENIAPASGLLYSVLVPVNASAPIVGDVISYQTDGDSLLIQGKIGTLNQAPVGWNGSEWAQLGDVEQAAANTEFSTVETAPSADAKIIENGPPGRYRITADIKRDSAGPATATVTVYLRRNGRDILIGTATNTTDVYQTKTFNMVIDAGLFDLIVFRFSTSDVGVPCVYRNAKIKAHKALTPASSAVLDS